MIERRRAAYRHGRTDYLDLIYTEDAVQVRIDEINGFIDAAHHVGGHVEHNYTINIQSPSEANVIDGYWNHLVKSDPVSHSRSCWPHRLARA